MTLGSKIFSIATATFAVSSASAYVSYANRDISETIKKEEPKLEKAPVVKERANPSEFTDWPGSNDCNGSCLNPMEIAL